MFQIIHKKIGVNHSVHEINNQGGAKEYALNLCKELAVSGYSNKGQTRFMIAAWQSHDGCIHDIIVQKKK